MNHAYIKYKATNINIQLVTKTDLKEKTMKNATALTRGKSIAIDTASVESSKIGVGAIGVASVLIGCWAVVCLVSAMISSGGPVSLVSSYITAISG